MLIDGEDGIHFFSSFQWRSPYACPTQHGSPAAIYSDSFVMLESEAESDNDLVASPPPPLQDKRLIWVLGPLIA